MGTIGKLSAVVFGPGLVVGLVAVISALVDAVGQDRCSTVQDCFYAVHLTGFIAALVIICSAAGFLFAGLLRLDVVRVLTYRWLAAFVLSLALVQIAMFFALGHVPQDESADIRWLLVGWAVVSGLSCVAGLATLRRLAPNNSSKPTPLRGAA